MENTRFIGGSQGFTTNNMVKTQCHVYQRVMLLNLRSPVEPIRNHRLTTPKLLRFQSCGVVTPKDGRWAPKQRYSRWFLCLGRFVPVIRGQNPTTNQAVPRDD